MSSIANPRRTETATAAVPDTTRRHAGTALAALVFAVLLVSFRPFQPMGAETTGGDIVNQIGFSTLGLISLAGIAGFAPPRFFMALWSPAMLVLFALFVVAVMHALDPGASARAASFTVIGVLGIAAVLVVPRDADSFSAALAIAAGIVLGLSYAGLVLLPDVAMHTASGDEPQHAGLWRGVFTHKNVAGPVMACLAFAGVYLFRRGWRRCGGAIFTAAIVFVMHTGSKTTAGLVPLTVMLVMLPNLVGMRGVAVLCFALALAGTALGTLGIVFLPPLKAFAAAHFPDLTYTGRTTLWEFSGEMLAKRPWFGYGYDSFWGSSWVRGQDKPFDSAWDIRTIVHGHDGYLDIAVTMGLPALVAAVFAFMVEPLRDYMRVPRLKENVRIADFFMMVTLFTALNAFLESFFFRRADPVWLFFVFGVLGLRLAARFPIRAAPR